MKLKVLAMSALLAVSAVSLVSCGDAAPPSEGTYNVCSAISGTCPGTSGATIKIDSNNNVKFSKVWMNRGARTGNVDVLNARENEDSEASDTYYWKATAVCHYSSLDNDLTISNTAWANKKGNTIYIASGINAYSK